MKSGNDLNDISTALVVGSLWAGDLAKTLHTANWTADEVRKHQLVEALKQFDRLSECAPAIRAELERLQTTVEVAA